MKRYNPKEIEPKWQQIWDEQQTYHADLASDKPKYFAMSMFNYPSGHGIHIGHAMNYTISDVMARFKRQQGYESYHPVGWDAFGLPAENYAIKTGVSPQESMASIIPGYHAQYKAMGWSNDWSKEIATCDPEYYKWTQWIFWKMYEQGMVYQDERLQWWCTKCQTVLSNEQVIDGKCWRHDAADDPEVGKKAVKQWFFRITDYANEMLEATHDLDWSEAVKTAQINWIGKSEGAEVSFALAKDSESRVASHESRDSLKFTPALTDLVKRGEKTNTIRLEAKNLAVGDVADLLTRVSETEVSEPFAQAKITAVRTMKLADIPLDLPGHEKYATAEDRLAAYRGYYGDQVSSDSQFTIYDFELCHPEVVPGPIAGNVQSDGVDTWIPDQARNDRRGSITVFTTRPDTLYGATFLVLAPEHELVRSITTDEQRSEIEAYITEAEKKSEVERQESKDKTGVFTGAYAVNPVNNQNIPIWIADYVLTGYGTGAIMAVPAHDERDNEFAQKFNLPIVQVVQPAKAVYTVIEASLDWDDAEGGLKEFGTLEVRETSKLWGRIWRVAVPRDKEAVFRDTLQQALRQSESSGGWYADSMGTSNYVVFHGESLQVDSSTAYERFIEKGLSLGIPKEQLDIAKPVVWHDEGVMVNSAEYDGQASAKAREQIVKDLEAKGLAKFVTNFRIRDWSVARQRYWGAPVPIINCPVDGQVLVPEQDLPVVLPELKDFAPSGDGRSALARATDWLKVDCPKCGGPAERETDTLDTYICSSWYFLRYLDPHNSKAAFDSNVANKWMPVDFYNGGDHATAHMIYARFVTRFFHKLGLLAEPEPFKKFLFNGKVTASDGTMFSKSKGNGVDPLEIIGQGYGADALRTYLMFAAPLELWMRWDAQGVPGTYRFLNRVWNLTQEFCEFLQGQDSSFVAKAMKDKESREQDGLQGVEVLQAVHPVIRKVTSDLEQQKYNTAIASMMELTNTLYTLKKNGFTNMLAWQFALESLAAMIAPFAPHTADELWHDLGRTTSVQRDSWPLFDEQYLARDTITLAVQVNGKLRGTIEVPADTDQPASVEAAKQNDKIVAYLDGHEIIKTIFVPGKLINFVVR
jgi:leucyl-tRNA synthetase